MKEMKKEVVTKTTKTVFVANDGTEFNDKLECEKYEKSAKGVLYAKYAPMVVKATNEEKLFSVGCCDDDVEIVKIETQEDADLVLQIFLLENPNYAKEENKENLQKEKESIDAAIGDFLIVCRGYAHDGFWLYGSRESIIDAFNKKFEKL